MSSTASERDPLEILAEEFISSQRRGENPQLEEYAQRYPDWANRIRQLFPMLLMLEDHRTAPSIKSAKKMAIPEKLGDYHIIREIGRGGMGVVYEANQFSLSRQVALKVLLPYTLTDPSYLPRFQQEARTAARLHHTNIVPVFGVGEQQGYHYFAMQYIEGRPLDSILKDVHHICSTPHSPQKSPDCQDDHQTDELSLTIAKWLFHGVPAVSRNDETSKMGVKIQTPLKAEGGSAAQLSMRQNNGHASTQQQSFSLSKSYQHHVAHLGMQLADALAHAHQAGVIHRDIKPANILLDRSGTAWLTDFGLAKIATVPDMTQTGYIVGTMRYMAPERFHGESHALSDVYSLGATLYEMLALQPAFTENRQDLLIQQILAVEPSFLRQLNPAIDRDLATIIHKAMTKDLQYRYASAAQMRDDLHRYLDGQPIQARPISWVEHLWLWSRRNPLPAALAALLVFSLTMGLLGMTALWWVASSLRDEATQNFAKAMTEYQRAERNRIEMDRQRIEANSQRDFAEQNLQLALSTVHDFYTTVSEQWLKDASSMRPFRKKLLNKALQFYASFSQQISQNDRLQKLNALAKLHMGELQINTGPHEEAIKNLLEAVTILEKLAGQDPTVEQRLELIDAMMMLCQLQNMMPKQAQQEVLEHCRAHLEVVLKRRPENPTIRNMLADVLLMQYAQLYSKQIMDFSYLEFANELLDHLHGESTTRQRFYLELAFSNLTLATYWIEVNRFNDAERALQRATEIANKETRNDLNSSLYDQAQLRLLRTNAHLAMKRKEYANAIAKYIEVIRSIESKIPKEQLLENLDLATDLAESYYHRGMCEKALNQKAAAQISFLAAQSLFEQIKSHPLVPVVVQQNYAFLLNNIGMMYLDSKQYSQAIEAFQNACKVREMLLQVNPENAMQHVYLAGEWNNIGNALRISDRLAEAVPAFKKAIEIQKSALRLKLRNPPLAKDWLTKHYTNLSRVYRDLGQFEEAFALIDDMQKTFASASYELAVVAREFMYIAQKMEYMGLENMEVEKQMAADLAVKALQQAVANGFQQRTILESRVFKPLAARADFQELLNKVKATEKQPPK